MRRLLSPFVLVLTAILGVGYAYVAWRLAATGAARVALALPFAMVWLVPVTYWVFGREKEGIADEAIHIVSYLCMGWLSFLVLITLARDAVQGVAWMSGAQPVFDLLQRHGSVLVLAGSVAALIVGALAAFTGPRVRHVDIPVQNLDPALAGLGIALISDLHVGPTIGERYVRRVVRKANALKPDLVALTGDMVDGSVPRLARHVAPLAELSSRHGTFFVLGNHDCYSGAPAWIAHFRSLGFTVLLNEHVTLSIGTAQVVIGGVVDPALRLSDPHAAPRPDLAAAPDVRAAFRILLAHNPRLAPLAQQAGFDLQLSGHTHAGQFFPWTLAVRLVHAPHVAGLSMLGRMHVYVSAGTGTWGPPVRLGTAPELTLIRLVGA